MRGDEEPAVSAWLAGRDVGLRAPFAYELVANGRSNLTYRVVDADGRAVALRRPPRGQRLPRAHDMAREYRILSALCSTPVPVPRPLALCTDEAVLGADFYVMEFVDGLIIRERADFERRFEAPDRRQLAFALVGALAGLHAVEPEQIGLGDLGRREDYIARQLFRWWKQYCRAAGADPDDPPWSSEARLLAGLRLELTALVPRQGLASLVHGDFRLGNAVVRQPHSVAAILDWETCTLGDPLADLGILLMSWSRPDDEDLLGMRADGLAPTEASGVPDRTEVVARYATLTGRDVTGIAYYEAFAWWRMACILHGVAARYRAGASGGDQGAPEAVEAKARGATEQARRALSSLASAAPSPSRQL